MATREPSTEELCERMEAAAPIAPLGVAEMYRKAARRLRELDADRARACNQLQRLHEYISPLLRSWRGLFMGRYGDELWYWMTARERSLALDAARKEPNDAP